MTNPDRLRTLERRLHLGTLDWRSTEEARRDLLARCGDDPELFLDVLDALVAGVPPAGSPAPLNLERMLDEGGSAWTVGAGAGQYQLQRRVDPTVAAAARATISGAGRAGAHLAEAWAHTYGRHPNPGHAYREAVRAVEAAAIPVVCPADTTATLGKILGQLHTGRHFAVALHPAPPADPTTTLVAMLEVLWKAQLDRHGTPDPSTPLSVSEAEARTAVHLATTLVHWFTSGAVVKAP